MRENFLVRTNCPICNGTTVDVFSEPYTNQILWEQIAVQYGETTTQHDWQGASFTISHCKTCDFYYTKEVPSDDFYEKIAERSVAKGLSPERERLMGSRHYGRLSFECERISSIVGRVPGEITVLEFGTGFGHWLLMAKAFNYQTVGVEIYEDRITYAEKNGLAIHRTIDAILDESVDFAFTNQVIEHLNDPLPLLQSVVRKVRRGGYVQIGVPNGNDITTVISQYKAGAKINKLIGPIGHINSFTHKALVSLAHHAGLSLVSSRALMKSYLMTMFRDRDIKYLPEILLAHVRQHKSCYLYFKKNS